MRTVQPRTVQPTVPCLDDALRWSEAMVRWRSHQLRARVRDLSPLSSTRTDLLFSWVSGALGASARTVKGLILATFGPESKELKKFDTFWDDIGVEDSERRKGGKGSVSRVQAPERWEPQGWTVDLLAKQLAASQLPPDILINNERAAKI